MLMLDLPSLSVEADDQIYKGLPVLKLQLKKAEIDGEYADNLLQSAEFLEDAEPKGALLIENTGKNFCLGWKPDFNGGVSARQGMELAQKWEKAVSVFYSLSCPTVVKINGHCLGWGLSLTSVCDWRWCTQDAIFASTELDFGLPPGMYSWQLPALVGLNNARRLVMAGQTVSAVEAVKIGLADEIVNTRLDDIQTERLRNFSQKTGPAWQNARRLLNESGASLRENHLGTYLAALSQSLSRFKQLQ